jgi:hypothetical protein
MMMMTFEFLLTFDVNGSSAQRSYSVADCTLPAAVTRSLDELVQEQPDAQFKGLTYYAPGFESPASPLTVATRTASAA